MRHIDINFSLVLTTEVQEIKYTISTYQREKIKRQKEHLSQSKMKQENFKKIISKHCLKRLQESWAERSRRQIRKVFQYEKKSLKRMQEDKRGEWEKARVKNFCCIYTVGLFYKEKIISLLRLTYTHVCPYSNSPGNKQ